MQKYFHLDSEYRNRWQEYSLADGRVMDSRQINWRHVDWERVVRIDLHIHGKNYYVDCKHSNFLFFMCFRWAGWEWIRDIKRKINLWTIGWSDGEKCFLVDIDFKTGEFKKRYIAQLSQFKEHIHPRIDRSLLCLQ